MQRLNLDRAKLLRNRTIRACGQCRARKIKCDQLKPHCQICTANSRVCIYVSEVQKSSGQLQNHGREEFPMTTAQSTMQQPSDAAHPQDQTISLNQFGRLTGTNDAQLRYYSSSSWVSAIETSVSPRLQPSLSTTFEPDSMGSPSLFQSQDTTSQKCQEFPAEQMNGFVQLGEVDQLISWYSQFCQFWYPIIDVSEITTSLGRLRSHQYSPAGSSALIAAICYSAACSAEAAFSADASVNMKHFKVTPSSWEDLAYRLLSASGYPLRPNLNTIRAAFLLATPSIAECKEYPDPVPICVLVRAAQSLGLHREPVSFNFSSREADFRRVLWWSIHGLDISYAVAHALPPLIQSTNSDVRMIFDEENLDRRLLSTLIRVNLLFSKIFEDIYGIDQPTRDVFQLLDEEVANVCADVTTKSRLPATGTLEKFIGFSQRMCCRKMTFTLHQPYLRSAQWPQSSRRKALEACRDYINEFTAGAIDPNLAPYRWVLNHFNVIHACAIVLQDLIQHPNCTESVGLRGLMEKCFSIFSKTSHPSWEKLETLRWKAWAANRWVWGEQEDVGIPDADASLSDWDPLFASFVWDDALLEQHMG
ncbi:hypothetical protein POJ06DRAFT_255641 [Lipomyces tetrasporus]|uniref:Zn(2)-C6 fungal-type domain-containing protein n=1 Tax=Lipomyces tetrasporus TaxID=54092 RepID=A0AAD7VSZ8_9ASCO|nr:uncharacterized protein POJ06DRAFT_255641 [Lipomyces tetrasporus]KAJ8100179.1 hypothetical protein POJ06DRAFT_255641 [Lipomyces tetrasporus]